MGSGCSRLGPTGLYSHTWGVLDTFVSLEIMNWLPGFWEQGDGFSPLSAEVKGSVCGVLNSSSEIMLKFWIFLWHPSTAGDGECTSMCACRVLWKPQTPQRTSLLRTEVVPQIMLRSDFFMYHYTSPAAWPKNPPSVLQKREPDLRLWSKIYRVTQVYSCSASSSFLWQFFALLLNETLMAGKELCTFIPRAKQSSAKRAKVSRKQKAEKDSSWPNLQVLGKARASAEGAAQMDTPSRQGV